MGPVIRPPTRGPFSSLFYPSDLGALLIALWDAERSDLITAGATLSVKDTVAAYDALQATASAQPAYSATSFNGRPGFTHDGTDDQLTCTASGLLAQLGGATSYEMWGVIDQTALVADTGARTFLSVGAANTTSRVAQRAVVSAANRARGVTGDGAGATTVNNTSVDFSGRHVVRVKFTATGTTVEIDGVTMAEAAVVPSTTATRVRIGAAANTSASLFWQGVWNAVAFTRPLDSARAAQFLSWANARRS